MKLSYKNIWPLVLTIATFTASAQTPVAPTLKDLKGQVIKLDAYRDQLLLVNFWASWCIPCRKEMPDLDQLYGHYDPRSFTVLGVAADELSEVQTFLTKLSVHYPIAVGDPDQVFAWSARLGNQSAGLPFSVLLDKTGKVRWTKAGGRISVDELTPVIDKLLAEK